LRPTETGSVYGGGRSRAPCIIVLIPCWIGRLLPLWLYTRRGSWRPMPKNPQWSTPGFSRCAACFGGSTLQDFEPHCNQASCTVCTATLVGLACCSLCPVNVPRVERIALDTLTSTVTSTSTPWHLLSRADCTSVELLGCCQEIQLAAAAAPVQVYIVQCKCIYYAVHVT